MMYAGYVYSFFFEGRISAYLIFFLKVLVPFAYSLAAFWILKNQIPLEGDAVLADAWRSAARIGLYLLLVSPLLVYFLKTYGLWDELRRGASWGSMKQLLTRGAKDE